MKKTHTLLVLLLLAVSFPAPAGAQFLDHKTRKQLERENDQLRQRLEALQQEIEWLRNDAQERDSLVKVMNEASENEAAGMEAVDYFDTPSYYEKPARHNQPTYSDNMTDSLLSVWYLHRQARENTQGQGYDMDSVRFTSEVPDRVLIERLQRMDSFIQLPYNETVKNYMVLYSEKMPTKMGQILGLAKYYMPIFEEAFRRYGLPLELKYMAIIESALNPVAVSRVGATGMWQFMHATARN